MFFYQDVGIVVIFYKFVLPFAVHLTINNTIIMKKILFFVAVSIMAVSCSTQMATYSAKTANVPYSLKAVPTTAELDVAETKVVAEVKDRKGMMKKNAEDWAVSEALNKVSADILLEPRFEYTYNKNKLISVKVSGYPAKYKNFRVMNAQDAETLNKLNAPATETFVIIKETEKK